MSRTPCLHRSVGMRSSEDVDQPEVGDHLSRLFRPASTMLAAESLLTPNGGPQDTLENPISAVNMRMVAINGRGEAGAIENDINLSRNLQVEIT